MRDNQIEIYLSVITLTGSIAKAKTKDAICLTEQVSTRDVGCQCNSLEEYQDVTSMASSSQTTQHDTDDPNWEPDM